MFLPLVMLAALIILVGATILLMAHAILRPPRMTDGKALYLLHRIGPDDLGIPFERMSFTVRDEPAGRTIEIAGWWMPHPAGGDKTVVLIHGYADAKVGAIAWAPTWRALGYHILAIDLRAHGESGGTYTTAGVRERHDMDQVLNQLRAARPGQTSHLVLFGISLGAAVVLATATMRDDLAAIVLESPIANFRSGVRTHAELLGLPLPSLLPLVIRAGKWISGADFDEIRPVELVANCPCSVMIIQSGNDPFVPPENAKALRAALDGRTDGSVLWSVENVSHLMAMAQDPKEYQHRIADFLAGISDRPS